MATRKKPPDLPRQERWLEECLLLEKQCLFDVAVAQSASVGFVCHPEPAVYERWLERLAEQALELGFAVASVNLLASRGFDTLDALVRAALRALRAPWAPGLEGLVELAVAAGRSAGDEAVALRAALEALSASTALPRLCSPLLETGKRSLRREAALHAWLDGVRDAEVGEGAEALSQRNAHGVLGDLALIVQALGARGLVLIHGGGEVLTKLPEGRRARAWGVLRELVDNADGARFLRAARVVVAGTPALFAGPRSLAADDALAGRVLGPLPWPPGTLAPHRPWNSLVVDEGWAPPEVHRVARVVAASRAAPLRALIRASQGLPVPEARFNLSVAHEAIDATLDKLFAVTAMDGSVFAVLSGAFGSGKTHTLLHLTERALAEKRPVLRLSLERLDVDLGHPQRHLHRMLSQGTLPLEGRPSPLEWLARQLSSSEGIGRLYAALRALSAGDGDVSAASRELLTRSARLRDKGRAAMLGGWLGALELTRLEATPAARRSAYLKLLLWLNLLEKLEGTAGPVLLLDEVEALFRGAATRAERRSALRSLAFYCGGTLPRTLVMLAVTPAALDQLRAEAPTLLDELSQSRSLLPWEDVAMLHRRLRAAPVLEPPRLTRDDALVVAGRLAALHAQTRDEPTSLALDELARTLWAHAPSARQLVRGLADALERRRWS